MRKEGGKEAGGYKDSSYSLTPLFFQSSGGQVEETCKNRPSNEETVDNVGLEL